MNLRDAFYEILRAHGITTIFGNPGSNELPMLQDFLSGTISVTSWRCRKARRSGWRTASRRPQAGRCW